MSKIKLKIGTKIISSSAYSLEKYIFFSFYSTVFFNYLFFYIKIFPLSYYSNFILFWKEVCAVEKLILVSTGGIFHEITYSSGDIDKYKV